MAQRRFLPAQGDAFGISHYFELIGDLADRVGVATPMLDRAAELYQRCIDMGLGRHDNAVMVDVIGSMPRRKPAKTDPAKKPARQTAAKVKKAGKKKVRPGAKKALPKANKKASAQAAHKKTARPSKSRRRAA
jgi:hypothetical protein